MLGCSRGEDEWGAKLRGSLKTIGNTKKNQVFEYDCSTRPSGRVRIETFTIAEWAKVIIVAPDLRVG